MHLSRQTIETLIDLVENKLSAMEVWDRSDRRELNQLQRCLRELSSLSANGHDSAIGFPPQRRRRGRPPKSEAAVF